MGRKLKAEYSTTMMDPMFKKLKRWFSQMAKLDPHVERIIENASEAVRRDYQIEHVKITRLDRSPCDAMKNLPRPGPAWFLVTPHPWLKSILIVEVDDATEQVTRIWRPPS